MYMRVPAHAALGESAGPFEGTFVGEFPGDEGTKTSITAVLTHKDSVVAGTITLGSGLKLDFPGPCFLEPVDLRQVVVEGKSTAPGSSRAVVAGSAVEPTSQFGLKSLKIDVSIAGELTDSSTLKATVTMKPDHPLCWKKTFEPILLMRKP